MSPASLYCVLELDNTRLQTQPVGRSSCPVWNKEFQLAVRDITSCLVISLLDRDRGTRTNLLGRVSLPLLLVRGTAPLILRALKGCLLGSMNHL